MQKLFSLKKLSVRKIKHLKTKKKEFKIITFDSSIPSEFISAFDFLKSYVINDQANSKVNLKLMDTEFGYNLLNSSGNIDTEYVIEEVE